MRQEGLTQLVAVNMKRHSRMKHGKPAQLSRNAEIAELKINEMKSRKSTARHDHR